MFEGDLSGLDEDAVLSAAVEFRGLADHAEVRLLQAALQFADLNHHLRGHHDTDPHTGGGARGRLRGRERTKVYGGPGCPGVAEFAPAEFGAALGMSPGAAAAYLGEALALRHRLPRTWAAVLAGDAAAWRARQIARACLKLTEHAAALVDARAAGIVNTVSLGRLQTIVTAAIWQADPDAARAAAERAARDRGVWVGQSDEHGTKTIYVKAAAGDVIRLDATIDTLAHALKELGDPDSLDLRRAKVIGWIADPQANQSSTCTTASASTPTKSPTGSGSGSDCATPPACSLTATTPPPPTPTSTT
ncbi:MAG TPA: DUF222 domain-containing protein [Kribbella sp.]|nr:DUF222 domain-containing protein [Kribbella sp.]